MNNLQNKELCLVVSAGVTVNLLPDDKHEFLMTEQDVAKGYSVTVEVIKGCMYHHTMEFVKGKHFLSHSPEDSVMWTKRGVVRLGFFIDGPKAKTFRDMIEDLQLSPTPESSDTFTFGDNYPVRVVMISGEPWFVARDVCKILGIRNASLTRFDLDEDEKGIHKMYTLGGAQKMTVVSESGLYTLIFHSHKPGAKAFRKWVTSEVLPAIRRTGKYTPEIMENDCPYTANLPGISHCPETKGYATSAGLLLDIMDDICHIEDYSLHTRIVAKIKALCN
jgi:hypothetical protein